MIVSVFGVAFIAEQFVWLPAQEQFNEENRFRLSAYDRVGNVSSYTTQIPVTIVSEEQPLPFVQGWNLVGAPLLEMQNEEQQLARAYRFSWNGTAHEEFTGFSNGNGFWLGALEPGEDQLKGSIAEDDVELDLVQGWSIVSSPLMRTVYLDSITVTNLATNESLSYVQAMNQDWLVAPLAYLNLAINGSEQQLLLGDHQLRNMPAPPPAPNSTVVGMLGAESVLGNLYLQLGMDVQEQRSVSLYRSDANQQLELSWEDHAWTDITATLVRSNGQRFNLLEAGNVVISAGEQMPSIMLTPRTVSAEEANLLPTAFELQQNYPNPFNPSTQIRFSIPEQTHVRLSVYNMLGQQIAVLLNETRSSGWHDVTFDASSLSSGVYLYRIEAGNFFETRQMMLVK